MPFWAAAPRRPNFRGAGVGLSHLRLGGSLRSSARPSKESGLYWMGQGKRDYPQFQDEACCINLASKGQRCGNAATRSRQQIARGKK